MKNLIYKVLSNEHTGLKQEFTNKRDARNYAATQRKAGWTAKIVDMRNGVEVK